MTYRIYVRWPEQRVSDKTSTESDAVASFAFKELQDRLPDLLKRGALGVAMTRNGQQVRYVNLMQDAAP